MEEPSDRQELLCLEGIYKHTKEEIEKTEYYLSRYESEKASLARLNKIKDYLEKQISFYKKKLGVK